MAKNHFNMALSSYNDIFTTDVSRNSEEVMQIPLSELKPFNNQPFKVLMDEEMDKLIESIKENGVLNPIIARPIKEGGYEILSGHRRTTACGMAGIDKVPVIVKDLDDDTASILLVDSNLHRENILPSEKAFAYRMRIEAMKRKAGRPDKANFVRIGQNSRKELSEQTGESSVQIQRYIRLTYLITPLLDMVDNKKLAMNAAVELSYIDNTFQEHLSELLEDENLKVSITQAKEIREYCESDIAWGDNCYHEFSEILKKKDSPKKQIAFKTDKIKQYFPDDYTTQQMEDTLIDLLEKWSKSHMKYV